MEVPSDVVFDMALVSRNMFITHIKTVLMVRNFFQDDQKSLLWFDTPNPLLGGVRPLDMFYAPDKLYNFVCNQLEEITLIDAKGIAQMIGVCERQVSERISHSADFPSPFVFGRKTKGWDKSEIMEWIRSKKQVKSA